MTGPSTLPSTTPSTGSFGYPIFVEVRDASVFVAGGGREAAPKARAIAALGARVRFWAADPAGAAGLEREPGIEIAVGDFDADLIDGARLALVDTGDRPLDRMIADAARERRVLVNVVDDTPSCDWSAPAILRRGDLTLAIATAGIAPALAVRLRDELAESIGPEYGELLRLFAEVRPRITASGRPFVSRRRLWYELVDGPVLGHLREGREDDARRAIVEAIEAWEAQP